MKQSLLICQDNQQICINNVCNQTGEVVVVAKFNVIGRDCIILVYDWDDAHFQQTAQSVTDIEISCAIGQVGVGEQNLSCTVVVLLKFSLISANQPHLSYGGCDLQQVNFVGTLLPTKTLHPLHNRSGRHQDNLHTITFQFRDLLCPRLNSLQIDARLNIGDQ